MSSAPPPFLLQLPHPILQKALCTDPPERHSGLWKQDYLGRWTHGRTDGHVSWEVRQTEKQAEGGSSRTAEASKNII